MTTNIHVQETLRAIQENAKALTQNATLDRLHTVQGASWDISRACLENTCLKLINGILAWIDAVPGPDSTSQPTGATIMLLKAVTGAGKTTVVHTVARICAERKQLASSFFFDRKTEGRNTPKLLFSTIAADLSRMDRHIADRVTTAIEENGSLPSAPISNQFVKLVLEPSKGVSLARPAVIVIDALDEAWDDRLLHILRDQACDLPSVFRIFLTSRMRPELEFAPHKVCVLANDIDLGDDWPGEELTLKLVEKAGGLFQWITTMCDYLRQFTNPTRKLTELLSSNDPASNSAEEKMDRLYATIIESFNWRDEEFINNYQVLMGTAIASKTPMSIPAMEELYGKRPITLDLTLRRLNPLLTGMNKVNRPSQPVRLLHQSLRDFLVYRFASSPEHACFHTREKDKNTQLAVLYLSILSKKLEMNALIPHYLVSNNEQKPGIPKLVPGAFDESRELQKLLVEFMKSGLITWLETTASYGSCYNISEAWRWAANRVDEQEHKRIQDAKEKYASACLALIDCLDYEDRREESLVVANQAVELYTVLAKDGPESHNLTLARSYASKNWSYRQLGQRDEALEAMRLMSLRDPGNRLSDVGHHQDAPRVEGERLKLWRPLYTSGPVRYEQEFGLCLESYAISLFHLGRKRESMTTVEEGVEIRRRLAMEQPATYTSDFAPSLNNLSGNLSDMGRHREALAAIEEAVEIYRRLATGRPTAYTPDLARSLDSLSLRLYNMGRKHEALAAIEEAVEIYQRLTMERPAAYTPNLVRSLNSLSHRLSDAGRQNEALATIEDSVHICRRLTAQSPAAHNPDLAMNLRTLGLRLGDLSRHQDALSVIQELVHLYRSLFPERPSYFTLHLEEVLRVYSGVLEAVDQDEEAAAVSTEADRL
ncbi:hypothetical protein RhiLY_11449 [Ceratobasidium sp. AG-Ba]|nr:hypothetical protein RhiLY_11449 [Ceratobasidium sp. AG-Ba]